MLQTAKEFDKKFSTLPSLQIDSVDSGGSTLDPIRSQWRHHLDREDLESNLRSLPTELAEVRAEVKITISKGKCARLLDVF